MGNERSIDRQVLGMELEFAPKKTSGVRITRIGGKRGSKQPDRRPSDRSFVAQLQIASFLVIKLE